MLRDRGKSITLSATHAYLTGRTDSLSFPTTAGAYDEDYNGDGDNWGDVFVAKFDKELSTLAASTFVGGSAGDWAQSVVYDSGYVYVTGSTNSSDFPTTPGAHDQSYNLHTDNFLLRLTADLSNLDASTFFGGWNGEGSHCVVCDSGHIYVAGWTASHDFPTTPGAYSETDHGGTNVMEAFVSRFSSDLTALEASTYLGGANHDTVGCLAADDGHIYVTGSTASVDFPTTAGAYDTGYNGGEYDAFVAILDSDLTAVEASTFLGGSGVDGGHEVALDGMHVCVCGRTGSSEFPTTLGAHDETYNGGECDVFISKLDGGLATLEASTFLGGTYRDYPNSLIVDGDHVYVAGETDSPDFTTTLGAYEESYNGGDADGFIARLDTGLAQLEASTFIGGGDVDWVLQMTLDEGCVYVTGETSSSDFPVTMGAYDEGYNGGECDTFIAQLDKDLGADEDCNGNGVADHIDIAVGTSEDCNDSGVPDECELDFDGDGLIDDCDPDIDNDGVPNDDDVCDFTPTHLPPEYVEPDGSVKGDLDGDCDVDMEDFNMLQARFTGPNG